MKLIYQYMAIFFNFLPTSDHLHLLQVEKAAMKMVMSDPKLHLDLNNSLHWIDNKSYIYR